MTRKKKHSNAKQQHEQSAPNTPTSPGEAGAAATSTATEPRRSLENVFDHDDDDDYDSESQKQPASTRNSEPVSRDSSPLATSHRTPKSEQVLYEEDTQRSRQAIATASVINDAVKRAGNIAHELKSNVSAASVAFRSISRFGDPIVARHQIVTTSEQLVTALHDALTSAYGLFGPAGLAHEERQWQLARQDACARAISPLLMERSTAINVAHNKKMTELSTALLDAGKAGTLFTVDEVGNLMQTDRPYAQLVRSTLSGGAKLTVQPVFTADMSLGEYAESNWHQLTEAQTTWSDLGGSLARSSHMDEVFDNLISSGADNNDDEKADKRARVESLMARMILNRIQAEQCWDALAPSTSNDYTIVEAALAAPITSSSIYDYVLQEPATPDSRRAAQARFGNSPTTSMKPKAAIAAKKYVGVLAAPDAPGGRASRFITEIDAIGDVATTLTVDPGSEITVIDTDFLASLGEAVAQPAHSVAPTQIAGWNNTADGELHSAWLVAVRPQWCDEPRWVLMYAARIAGFVPGTIIWGIDAAEQVGTVVTMSRLAPPRCTAPQCEAPLAPAPTSEASESARVAIMAPDPSAPGLDGQCTAGEVISTIEASKFTVARAVDIALAKVDACCRHP